jgi:hypothetical protein
LLAGLALNAWGGEPVKSDQPVVRLFWLGSSSTYFNNMPHHVTDWLQRQAAGRTYTSVLAGKSGTGVNVYLRPEFKAEYGLKPGQTVLDRIRDEKPNYVILQAVCSFIAGKDGDEFDRSLDTYCQATRAAGGEPVFYEMGWGQGEEHERGQQRIFAAAVRNKVRYVAPCATAWRRVRQDRPDLALQHEKDKSHPGNLGNYLNVCCLYTALTGRPAEGMPTALRVWWHGKDKDKAQKTPLDPPLAAYAGQLAGWMKNNTELGPVFQIDDATAQYFATVAFATWQDYQQRLATEQK